MAHTSPPSTTVVGVRWTAFARYFTQLVDTGVSFYVARIVAPEAYGLLGMAMVLTGFMTEFRTLGLGAAIVQRKSCSDRFLNTIFWTSIGLGFAFATCVVVAAPLVGWFYADKRVSVITAALSLSFVLSAPSVVPGALLSRRMEFKRLAFIDIATNISRGIIAVTLATMGFGVWALVATGLVGALMNTSASYWACSWRPRLTFSRDELKSTFGFGANLTGFTAVNYVSRNVDNFAIATHLGPAALGHYSLAYRLLLLPRDIITNIVTRVLFPTLSRQQQDDEVFRSTYLRSCSAIALFSMPMMYGVAAIADVLVTGVLGQKWAPAILPIKILAPIGVLHSIQATTGQIHLCKGRTDLMFRLSILSAATIGVASFAAIPWGLVGVSSAVCFTYVLISWPIMHFSYSIVPGLQIRHLLAAIAPSFLCATTMFLFVTLTKHALLLYEMSAMSTMFAIICEGAVVYAFLVVFFQLDAVSDVKRLLPARFHWLLERRRTLMRGHTAGK